MVPLVRYTLVVLCLAAVAALLVTSGLVARHLPETASLRTGLLLGGLLVPAGLLAAAAVAILRFRDPARERELAAGVLLAAVSTGVGVGLLELALSRVAPALTYSHAAALSPRIYRASDIVPFELVPGYRGPTYMWEADATIDLTINDLGYRGPAFSPEKPPGTYRILVLGDSFGINMNVPDEELHTIVLEKGLNAPDVPCRVEVVNAGFAAGYSPDAYVAYMLHKGFDLDPDLVILQYFVLNDFKDLLGTQVVEWKDGLAFRVRSKYRYIDDQNRLRRKSKWKHRIPVLRDSHLFMHLWNHLGLEGLNLELVRALNPRFEADNFVADAEGLRKELVYADASARPARLQDAFERSLDHVRGLHREATRRGVDFVLFVVPTGAQTSRDAWREVFGSDPPARWERPNPQAQIAAALEPDRIEIFDPLTRYRQAARDTRLYLGADRDGHWTPEGSRLTGELLREHLAPRVALTCAAASRAR